MLLLGGVYLGSRVAVDDAGEFWGVFGNLVADARQDVIGNLEMRRSARNTTVNRERKGDPPQKRRDQDASCYP